MKWEQKNLNTLNFSFIKSHIFVVSLLCYNPIAQSCDSTAQKKVKCIDFFEDGQKKSVRTYKNGQSDGIFLFYNKNGFYSKKVKYKNGKWIYTKFYKNGKKIRYIDVKGREIKYKACGC